MSLKILGASYGPVVVTEQIRALMKGDIVQSDVSQIDVPDPWPNVQKMCVVCYQVDDHPPQITAFSNSITLPRNPPVRKYWASPPPQHLTILGAMFGLSDITWDATQKITKTGRVGHLGEGGGYLRQVADVATWGEAWDKTPKTLTVVYAFHDEIKTVAVKEGDVIEIGELPPPKVPVVTDQPVDALHLPGDFPWPTRDGKSYLDVDPGPFGDAYSVSVRLKINAGGTQTGRPIIFGGRVYLGIFNVEYPSRWEINGARYGVIEDEKWYDVVITNNGRTVRLYVNGELQSTDDIRVLRGHVVQQWRVGCPRDWSVTTPSTSLDLQVMKFWNIERQPDDISLENTPLTPGDQPFTLFTLDFRSGALVIARGPAATPKGPLPTVAFGPSTTIRGSAPVLQQGLSEADVRKAIETYGPVLRFHPDEQYLMCSIEAFLAHAKLHDGKTRTDINHPVEAQLPTGPEEKGRYWLILEDSFKGGDPSGAKAYVHAYWKPGLDYTDLQFWFFYAYNGPGTAHINGLIADTIAHSGDPSLAPLGEHYGDWECFMVRIDNESKKPIGVWLSQHSSGQMFQPNDLNQLQRKGDQFVVYASRNGHAVYPAASANYTEYRKYPDPAYPAGIEFRLRNDTKDGGSSLDCAQHYELVSADWLRTITEPPWLQYPYRWGPEGTKVELSAETCGNILEAAMGWVPYRPVVEYLAAYIVAYFETEDLNGPSGPKMKDTWTGGY